MSSQASNSDLTLQKQLTNVSASAFQNANDECVAFVWLDLRRDLSGVFVGALRAINDCVRVHTDASTCLDYMKSSNEKIFFISSSTDAELLSVAHQCAAVEAIFVLDSESNGVRAELPKLINSFTQQEELLRALRTTLDSFESIQLEKFVFENGKEFLWWQLWKEDIKSQKVMPNGKSNLVQQAQNYSRSNSKRLKQVEEFDKSYRPAEALRWCFRSPFPARPFRRALMSPSVELLSPYRFLVIDAVRAIQQQSKRQSHGQVYRGMKLPSDLVDLFETHTGQLVCINGFFMCTKFRNTELQSAASPGYRTDLLPVLFKVDFDASALLAEVTMDNNSTFVVFDVATCFRILCVNRGSMTIIKMNACPNDGRKIALEYKENNKGKTIKILLEELSTPPKPPTPPPPPKVEVRKETQRVDKSLAEQEAEAAKYLKNGDIDRAIASYQRIQPMSIRILKLLGRLYADEKKDYDKAIECYKQALKLQEEVGEDVVDTLSQLGTVYHNRGDYDLALTFHSRALSLYEMAHPRDSNAIATSLTNVSNVHRARNEPTEALDYAQRAWTFYESSKCDNEAIVAKSLVLLTSIHHDLGDDAQALKLGTRALSLIERGRSPNLPQTADLLNTLGLAQTNLGDLLEARHYFERSLKIYAQIAPLGQDESCKTEKNLQCVLEMQKYMDSLQHYS